MVTECRGLVAEEMAKMRAEMAQEESRRGQEAAALRSELALATEASRRGSLWVNLVWTPLRAVSGCCAVFSRSLGLKYE